ncbi:MAG: hypothetical protein ACM3TR_11240, partial [Caulobacteraceae bacterium]
VKDITSIVQKHLNDIKQKNLDEAVKYWVVKEDTEFYATQRKIVEDLINNAGKYSFNVGEIELWSLSDPHRSETPENSTYAKVKVVIWDGKNTTKYKLILKRYYGGQFEIESWNNDPLGISQLF